MNCLSGGIVISLILYVASYFIWQGRKSPYDANSTVFGSQKAKEKDSKQRAAFSAIVATVILVFTILYEIAVALQ